MVNLEEPDKGRAWLVAIAACIINMILSGLSRMVGILYVAVIDEYGVTRQEATVPFSIRNAIRCLSGPLVGIMGQRFGIRTITFFGGVIASAGAALCYIAPNILWVSVLWGGVHGFGFAMANTLFQVIVNQYFQKYRATASGIALSGACIGSLGFPVLLEWIIGTFGLSGGFLIVGGMVMHVLPPSLLLSSPQWIEYPKGYARLYALKKSTTAAIEAVDSRIELEDQRKLCKQLSRSTSLDNCPAESVTMTGASRDNLHKISEENGLVFESNGIHDHKKIDNKNAVICTRFKIQGSPKWDKNVERQYGAYLKTPSINTISESVQNDPNNQPEGPYASSKSQETKNQSTQSITQILKSMVKLYTNPVYVLINVCRSTYVLIFIPILTVIVDYGIDKGISEVYGKYLINSMAIGDLIGRLGFGWVTDKKLMTVSSFMCLTFILQGISIMLFPLATSLASFMALLILYGIMAGAILVVFPVLVLTYLDISTQTVGMACMPFMSGIMSFAIPPMIGHFRDDVGSYDGMFYLTGIISIVSGGGWLLEPLVAKWYYGKKDMKADKEANVHNENANQNNLANATDHQNKSAVR